MKNIVCHLKILHCYRASESDGDELFLKFMGNKIWPERKKYIQCKDDCSVPLNVKLPEIPSSGNIVKLELWNFNLFANNFLGEFNFFIENDLGEFKSDLRSTRSNRDHKYSIDYVMKSSFYRSSALY